MPKTEVILTNSVAGLGAESDQVKVAAGFARNYLFPQGLAVPVNGANKRRLEALRQRRAEREAKDLNSMLELSQTLSKLTLPITVKTGEDGKMFGSVTAGTIADELKHQFDATLDKRKIHLPHGIKTLGEHEVELHLHSDVNTILKVKVSSSTPLPAAAEAKPSEGPVSEKRGGRRASASEKPAERRASGGEKASEKAKPEKATAEKASGSEKKKGK
jgi:large subunit ribosomal protein L9